jgi:hypothetical protein
VSNRARNLRRPQSRIGSRVARRSCAWSCKGSVPKLGITPWPVRSISLGRLVQMDGKDGIAIMGMLILTLTSAFGPFGLYLMGTAGRPERAGGKSVSCDGAPALAKGQGGEQGARTAGVSPYSAARSAHGVPGTRACSVCR